MTTFPPLIPDARSHSTGVFPISDESSFIGGEVRFLHGVQQSGDILDLAFSNLPQADASLIRDHYRSRHGGHLSFRLSPEVRCGLTAIDKLAPLSARWRYAAPPEETHRHTGAVDVRIQLVRVR